MINKKRVVPQLRFRGFTDDWEQRKASNIFKSVSTKGYSQLPVLSASQEDGMVLRDNIGIDIKYDQKSLAGYKLVRPGQFVIHLRSFQGGFAYSTIEGITSPAYTIIDFLDKSQNIPEFWKELLKSTSFIASLVTVTYGIRDGRSISFSDFGNLKLNYPSAKEQKRIAEFLQILERAIALHQRKHELLLKLKQAYLQKLFPKYGNKIPELRFAGFTDDWEQRKLGEIAIRVRGNDGRMNLPTLTISAGNGWMDQRDRFSQNIAGKEQKNYTLLRQGELSYNHGNSKLAQFGAVFELESYNEALVPRVYHSFSVTADAQPKFIEQMFATHRPDRELRKLVSSGARMDGLLNINYDDFMGIKVWLPSMAEQQAIAGLLVKLDNTIALHQERLDQLKQLKKAYLQKLFV